MDSAFGAGTPGHVFAAISTTVEATVFETLASKAPREYPDDLHQFLLYSVSVMFVFTWAVVVLEVAIPIGREREGPLLLPPPPSPRLLLRQLASAKYYSTKWARGTATTTTIHVRPFSSSAVPSDSGCDDSDSEKLEEGNQKPGWGGVASIVPIEE